MHGKIGTKGGKTAVPNAKRMVSDTLRASGRKVNSPADSFKSLALRQQRALSSGDAAYYYRRINCSTASAKGSEAFVFHHFKKGTT